MTVTAKTESERILYQRPESLEQYPFHFCPGCGHGITIRLVAEVIDELKLRERAVCVASIGCSVNTYHYFNFDGLESAHGRAPAVATAIKRCNPYLVPFTYQGDGDLASIGMAEIVHACARGENFTVIFVNNAIYGMTGGQMAPTTLLGMSSTSSPGGRQAVRQGYPIRVSEMLATLDGPAYVARTSVHNPANVRKAKQAIKLAFRAQLSSLGTSVVEVLSPCPSNWKLSPPEAMQWLADNMLSQFPLGEFKVTDAVAALRKEPSNG